MSAAWKVAGAKAQFSRVLRAAEKEPQIIERRGQTVAVVINAEEYRSLAAARESATREAKFREFLKLSAEISASGGGGLKIPRRRSRPAPSFE